MSEEKSGVAKPDATNAAVLGGGCFWCLEAVFAGVKGVSGVASGYCGGHVVDPTYEQVCDTNTGHAEVIQVRFDPDQLPFATLLEMFFTIHDPTTKDRQGGDVGPQYRSVIFCQDAAQRAEAEATIRRLKASGKFPAPIVTEVADAAPFYAAEDYHQSYYRLHGQQPYCSFVIAPKLAKFRQQFAAWLA